MRDKLLITTDYAPNTGGVARYLVGYAKRHGIDVLTEMAEGQGREERVNRKKLLWGAWPEWLPLLFWSFVYSRKYKELVVSNILTVGYAALLCSRPYTIILHGLDVLNCGRNRWKKFLAKIILERAEHIVVNSKATGELLYKVFGNPYQYDIQYPLIGPMGERDDAAKEKYSLGGLKVILSLGRLVRRKGQEKIIKLMPNILEEVPNAVFTVVGSGPEGKNLKVLVEDLRLRDRVLFLGKVKDGELPSIYSACDVFVAPSLPSKDDWEGFGMVCLEAAYFSKPVIATNTGGLSEALEDGVTGFVVKDDNELLEKIILLLKNESLAKKMGGAGEKRVREKFLI